MMCIYMYPCIIKCLNIHQQKLIYLPEAIITTNRQKTLVMMWLCTHFKLARLKSISQATKGKYWNIKCRYIHVGKMLGNEHRSIMMLTCSCWGLCMTLDLWIFMLVTPKLLTFFVILQQRWWNIHQSLMGNPWHSNVTMEMQNVIQRQTLKKCYKYIY